MEMTFLFSFLPLDEIKSYGLRKLDQKGRGEESERNCLEARAGRTFKALLMFKTDGRTQKKSRKQKLRRNLLRFVNCYLFPFPFQPTPRLFSRLFRLPYDRRGEEKGKLEEKGKPKQIKFWFVKKKKKRKIWKK